VGERRLPTPLGASHGAFAKLELECVEMYVNRFGIPMNQASVQVVVLALLRRYAARQQLAADAMQQLRPDLWFQTHQEEWTAALLGELKALQAQAAGIPQKGSWGEHDEWEYFFHGGGCRLVHTSTGEPIDWDAPNTHRFDTFWFLNYLQWVLAHEPANPALLTIQAELGQYHNSLREFTFGLLDQLQALGFLIHEQDNKYVLLQL
jgi:hypothetical protein